MAVRDSVHQRTPRPLLATLAMTSAAAAGVLALAPADAKAAYTQVRPPAYLEDSHESIFENLYGGDFAADGVNYTNGVITAERVDDWLPDNGTMGLVDGVPGEAADQVWHDGFTTARARARFARLSQSFGFFEGESGGDYTNLFDVTGSRYAVTGSAMLTDMRGLIWRWGRDRGGTGTHSSLPSENPDGLDHLITYQIQGLDRPETTWLLFWEDRNIGVGDQPNSDRDINDLVVEVTAIPEPSMAAAGAVVLALACARRRGRR